jgi:hypothetical protein
MKTTGTKAVPAPKSDDHDSWMAEDDLRTLISAEKIKADDKRMKRAMAKHAEMMTALKAVKKT